jgi:hypothetical protein
MHKDYFKFIDAYYYLIIVAYFVNYLEFKKVKSYVNKVYGLIELIAYHYQEVVSAVLEASREGMEKLNVLRVEQCEVVDRILYCLRLRQSNSTEIYTGNRRNEEQVSCMANEIAHLGLESGAGGERTRTGDGGDRGDGAMMRGGGVRGCVRSEFIESIGRFRDKLGFKSVLIPVLFRSSQISFSFWITQFLS